MANWSLLHGTLYATIYGIDRLHRGCQFVHICKTSSGPKLTKRLLGEAKRMILCRTEIVGSRLYATVDLEKARVGRTRMLARPQWDESFHIYCAHWVSNIIFTVKEDNPIGARLIGRAYVPVEDIKQGFEVEKWVDILDEDHNPVQGHSRIGVKLLFVNVALDKNWAGGISKSGSGEIPYTYFRQRDGCRVSLYQDAHVPDKLGYEIPLSGGLFYEHHRCWEDIFDAIVDAKHFIYITGWSVYTKITLIRDWKRPKPGGDIMLGELLKKKADAGVRVLLLVWDDRTSIDALKKDGLMATHDEETANFFRGSNVRCVLCPRNSDEGRSLIQGFETSTMFTHHQKTVVVDSKIPDAGQDQKRRIVSFVGGIDLCDGRYDTQEHPLFKTLGTIHRDDFHQPNFPGSSIAKGGPREPWHDIHCRLEGPVAWDVLYNFEQRWKKQVGDQSLLSITQLKEIIVDPSPVTALDDPETWNVQIFRSIDGGAAADLPETPNDAAECGLVSGKNNVIDRSIQHAYINAIRRAKDFIYIENQYFIGSSFGWTANDLKVEDINALHLIPKELSLKIVSKIEAGERFVVYVVIPMWPEGIPESASVQAILDWQRRTMEMMYTDIVIALRAKGLQANPRHYLTFFCLGNRESDKHPGEYEPPERPEADTDYSRAQQSRRFMIYVHSKMMIVDDEYIIVGSANINQRSMDGARDSEIAMGGFQPHHLAGKQAARGQIHGFRVSLWMEHLGMFEESFLHPESLRCVSLVNDFADFNWNVYKSSKQEEAATGHLMSYPVEITQDGKIKPLQGTEFFPDTKARVLGNKSEVLPSILTT